MYQLAASTNQLAIQSSPQVTATAMDAIPASIEQISNSFFKEVSMTGYPEREILANKSQPWRAVFAGPQKPSQDGRLYEKFQNQQ